MMRMIVVGAGLALIAAGSHRVCGVDAAAGLGATGQPAGRVHLERLEQGFVLLVEDKAGVASDSSPICLASNHNGWNPNDAKSRLTRRSDGLWQIVLPRPDLDSLMAFKFTRGGWETVEVDAEMNDIENRSLATIDAASVAGGGKPVIRLTIEHWRDERPSEAQLVQQFETRKIDAVGDVRRVEVVGGAFPLRRDLLVWLPPGYDAPENAQRRYRVLYLMDGQNIFEKPPGVPGEWRADETADELIRAGRMEPIIIVGIPNAAHGRLREYLPDEALPSVEPGGDAFVEFLASQVVPRIDRAFRTVAERQGRAIGGSSLGAVISLHAAMERPDLFGAVLAESPAVLIGNQSIMRRFAASETWPDRFYVGVSRFETGNDASREPNNAAYREAAASLAELARGHLGPRGENAVMLVLDDAGEHNEAAWARRLPAALAFLFPVRP